jgi:hypothetical protein
MIASRCRPGTISRKTSSRLPLVSVCWIDKPVTFPPRARKILHKAGAKRIEGNGKNNGDGSCRPLQYKRGAAIGDNQRRASADELGSSFCDALGAPFRPVIFDRDSAVLASSRVERKRVGAIWTPQRPAVRKLGKEDMDGVFNSRCAVKVARSSAR